MPDGQCVLASDWPAEFSDTGNILLTERLHYRPDAGISEPPQDPQRRFSRHASHYAPIWAIPSGKVSNFCLSRGAKIPPTVDVVRDFPFMEYTVYVLYSSEHDRLYIGQTEDWDRREGEHNRDEVISTRTYLPMRLVYREEVAVCLQNLLDKKCLLLRDGLSC